MVIDLKLFVSAETLLQSLVSVYKHYYPIITAKLNKIFDMEDTFSDVLVEMLLIFSQLDSYMI